MRKFPCSMKRLRDLYPDADRFIQLRVFTRDGDVMVYQGKSTTKLDAHIVEDLVLAPARREAECIRHELGICPQPPGDFLHDPNCSICSDGDETRRTEEEKP